MSGPPPFPGSAYGSQQPPYSDGMPPHSYPPGGYLPGYSPGGYPPGPAPQQSFGLNPPPNNPYQNFNYSAPQPGYGPPGMNLPSTQPNWMNRPLVPNCPPGLEYLTLVDQLLIKQKVEVLEG
ncbi:unnamed protein product [Protopolystoma xenopodis]|uniref:Uncharacterized protein n=1 Tax=Protopolystoma xenopodis TaxID=117903 RepID=A0A3S5ALZ7_9PLAT|nr:unnamed protein product [Protopolystoma xenopodis]